jgi:predicted kinase
MDVQKPLIVIVHGLPGTGKTTIARSIGRHFHLPILAKDGFKELLFDSLGWSDRQWSRQLSQASIALIFHILKELLSAGYSVIIEANFSPARDSLRFQQLQQVRSYQPMQVICITQGEVLIQRYQQRLRSGKRHPGHVDAQALPELLPLLSEGRLPTLEIPGPVLELDTTDFSQIDYAALFASIASFLPAQDALQP